MAQSCSSQLVAHDPVVGHRSILSGLEDCVDSFILKCTDFPELLLKYCLQLHHVAVMIQTSQAAVQCVHVSPQG